MGLLNYTTKVDADKTAMEIARCLSQHGAQAVLTEYDPENGYVTGISFKIKMGEQTMGFRLPVDWKPVYAVLTKKARISPTTEATSVGQASSAYKPFVPPGASLRAGLRRRWRW